MGLPPPQARKLKLSAVLDPTLDAEIQPLTDAEVQGMYERYRNRFGDFPSANPALGYVAATPWSACYAAAIKDTEFWNKELTTPTTLFLARAKGSLMKRICKKVTPSGARVSAPIGPTKVKTNPNGGPMAPTPTTEEE